MKIRLRFIKGILILQFLAFVVCAHAQSTGKHLAELNKMKEKYEEARKNSYTYFNDHMKSMEDGYLLDCKQSNQILLDCIEYWKECIAEGHDEVVVAIYRESNGDELTDAEFNKIYDKSRSCPTVLSSFDYYLLSTTFEVSGDGEVQVYEYSVRNESKKIYWYYSKAVTDVLFMNQYFDAKTDISNLDLYYSDNRYFTVYPDDGAVLECLWVDNDCYDLTKYSDTFQLLYYRNYKISFTTVNSISVVDNIYNANRIYGLDGMTLPFSSSTTGIRIMKHGNQVKKVFSPSK